MENPKLRPLEAFFADEKAICIRDPEGFSESVLLVHPAAFFICTLFDGMHSVMDIQNEFMRQFGEVLFTEQVKEIENRLDSCLFLENDRFARHKERVTSDFRASTVRKAAHAGKSYEEDPEALRSSFDTLIERAGARTKNDEQSIGRLEALMVPHIDIGRGGDCYAKAYGTLAATCRAKTFVILGISHMQSVMPYILTRKEYETPFGSLLPDTDFIDRLSSEFETDYFSDELVHRNEHSVEFQTLFLKYLFGEAEDIRIVPILCSSVARVLLSGKSPYEDEETRTFIDALAATIAAGDREVCIIAGVDMSHVGKRFGQDVRITKDFLEDLESHDNALIRYILGCDAEGFMRYIRRENDGRNVCGVPAIYTMLKILQSLHGKRMTACEGRLLGYGQSVEENVQSVVSFASAAFFG